MKEVINGHQYKNKDKKGILKKLTTVAGGLVLLNACDQKPEITDGTVYQKEYIKKDWAFIAGKYGSTFYEIDREAVSMPPTHEERGAVDKEIFYRFFRRREENWKVYIAQCPTNELPSLDKIKEECKTNSFDVPQEVYSTFELGKHANFKQPK